MNINFTLEQVIKKTQRGNRNIPLLFLLAQREIWVGGWGHVPAVLTPVMTQYPLYRRLGGI